ncbi:hypothetical protein [Salinarimonas ramus]|uniref:Uncharacterized protein n=1 Tax=Salinarimonas ramus TaxID=690164 RepID=A0A917Q5V3_9HYPH|nr:hypothetical protein [Salinarimonas ramus]GGK19750.1 hypothetical protein GCM10011322_03060 [Salinarimonas ramus]
MTAAETDLFGAPAGDEADASRDLDLHYALATEPSDEEAVLRRRAWVAATIGVPPSTLGTYDRTAYRELVSAYVTGRHMSCILLAGSVVERHVTLAHRVLGGRWRGTLEEKIERLRDLDTPIGFLVPKLRATIAAVRALGADLDARVPAAGADGRAHDHEARLEREAREALPVAIFVMTRLPAHLFKVAKGPA